MSNKRKTFYKPEYEMITGIVTCPSESVSFSTGNIKTVFDLIDSDFQIHTCVYWSFITIEKGEKVVVKGKREQGIFLVKQLLKNYQI